MESTAAHALKLSRNNPSCSTPIRSRRTIIGPTKEMGGHRASVRTPPPQSIGETRNGDASRVLQLAGCIPHHCGRCPTVGSHRSRKAFIYRSYSPPPRCALQRPERLIHQQCPAFPPSYTRDVHDCASPTPLRPFLLRPGESDLYSVLDVLRHLRFSSSHLPVLVNLSPSPRSPGKPTPAIFLT